MENLGVYNSMTYIRKKLSSLSELKKEYDERGHEEFCRIYVKYDSFIGSPESMDFLTSVLKKEKTPNK